MNYILCYQRSIDKRGDYVFLDWNLLECSQSFAMNTLEGIDSFTSNYSKDELLAMLLPNAANMISDEETQGIFVILYYENDKLRQLPSGVVFKENASFLNIGDIATFLEENYENKELLNKIFNAFNKERQKSAAFCELLAIINQRNTLDYENIAELSYLERRNLGMFIATKLFVHNRSEEVPWKKLLEK